MARTVVTGYDGSPAARAAVVEAGRRAGADGTVYVVHGFGLPPDFFGGSTYDRLLEERELRGRELLDELLGDDSLPPSRYEAELLGGPVADAIGQVARVRHADEIVIGSRGLGGVRALLGSVSRAVVADADRPVTIIPAAATGPPEG